MSVEETISKKFSKCDMNGHNWVTEEEFRVVFPRGYRDYDFKRKKSDEPLIHLSSLLEGQSVLHKSILVGHSTDTELLTELLQDKKDIPTRMTTHDGQQPAKRIKLDSYYFNNPDIQKNGLKHCFICSNICNCSLLRSLKPKVSNEVLPLFSKELPELPDIQLIDNLNNISIELLTVGVYTPELAYEENNISDSDTQILTDDESTLTAEHNEETNYIDEENLVYESSQVIIYGITDTLQKVEDDSTIIENDICEDLKNYFHINNVFDIFNESMSE
ncbi:unnamed protein product [Danaus chrysippus]|uniref:(African queen) hypothetical protein n=1 Tax=Danaus chrysippus TaxID=151541 RepID=A0A8J2QGA1_9NEOP|nr:unnamed protein product [Danaus chrysippus]